MVFEMDVRLPSIDGCGCRRFVRRFVDTLSQAVLFGTMAVQFGADYSVVLFAFAFILGMLLVDGANAVWVTSMLQRSESGARIVSRILGVSIAVLSLSVAGLKILSYCLSDA